MNENHICPICGGELVSEDELYKDDVGDIMLEDLLDEKKKKKRDACYYKVKARYKVWPSAYASGALVKCRKKGAKNWGTKSEGVEEVDEAYWKGYHKEGMKTMFGKKYPNCVKNKKEEQIMKEEQLRKLVRETIEEMYNEEQAQQDECWECYQTGINEDTGEITEECYRTTNWGMVPEADEHTCEGDQFYEVYGDINDEETLTEAEYRGRKVKLGKPMRGDVKKFKVFVRKPNGKIVKVNFGDKKMRIKKSNPKRRKSFRARHKCKTPGPRWKARYWSCRKW